MSDENTKITIKDQLDSFIKAYPKAKTLYCTFRGSGDNFDEFDDICVLNNKGKPIDFGDEFDFILFLNLLSNMMVVQISTMMVVVERLKLI